MSNEETKSTPPCFTDASQSTDRLVEMFVRMGQERRIRLGQNPAERAVFRKLHGVAQVERNPGSTGCAHLASSRGSVGA